jgi:hypothetical protein
LIVEDIGTDVFLPVMDGNLVEDDSGQKSNRHPVEIGLFGQMGHQSLNVQMDVHPEQIDYIVCDTLNDQNGWRQANYSQATANRRIANVKRLIQSGQWELCFSLKDVVILRRIGKAYFDR